VMSRLRGLRGSFLDPFRHNAEARLAREVLAEYESDIEFALARVNTADPALLQQLLNLPDQIRGYGHVRERHVKQTRVFGQNLRTEIEHSQSKAA